MKYNVIGYFLSEGFKNVFKNKKTNSLGRPKEFEINYKERYEILKKYQAFLQARREKK